MENRNSDHSNKTLPIKGIAQYVESLARKHKIEYSETPLDRYAETVTRLAGDEVKKDKTIDLLVALKRAGIISKRELAILLSRYLKEANREINQNN